GRTTSVARTLGGTIEGRYTSELVPERIGDAQCATQLVPLGEDDCPADQGQHDENRQHDFRRAGGVGHQLHRRAGDPLSDLQQECSCQTAVPTLAANQSYVVASPSSSDTSGAQPSSALALSTLTKDSCCSPGRCGANSTGTSLPAATCNFCAISSTLVPTPVPMLNARASSLPLSGSGFVAAIHTARVTSPTKT